MGVCDGSGNMKASALETAQASQTSVRLLEDGKQTEEYTNVNGFVRDVNLTQNPIEGLGISFWGNNDKGERVFKHLPFTTNSKLEYDITVPHGKGEPLDADRVAMDKAKYLYVSAGGNVACYETNGEVHAAGPVEIVNDGHNQLVREFSWTDPRNLDHFRLMTQTHKHAESQTLITDIESLK